MAGTNNGNGEDKPMVDPQKQYLIEQFGNLMEKVGEGYGGPLQEELIRRMEQTIADFDEEVSEMLEHLRDNSAKRHEKLKEIWENPEQSTASSDAPSEFPEDASDWEKRLEGIADDGAANEEAKEEPPKKKGLFGRSKK
ncbi:MAG: hypothetical protein CBC40_01395 [bacterium TMED80]|nr:MAG: hypothetical protein CBC40_01395 [bacterium TMED80]RZP23791.1 MAG: hypothetical protein EVA24_04565 [bacterium]|tara:strand:- start:260 stop:676 length:417 start_codon:yes stop_codon:yes gene_type:complete